MADTPPFDLVGGHPALDFLNTAGGRTKARDAERLPDYGEALRWSLAAGLVGEDEAERLRASAGASPREAERAVAGLREQREALHRFLAASIGQAAPDAADRLRVEADLKAAYAAARLPDPMSGRRDWRIDAEEAGLLTLHHRAALAAAALLTGDLYPRIGMCEACSWMFLDPSPSKRRRWCSMAACGNRAKARRHYRRAPARLT